MVLSVEGGYYATVNDKTSVKYSKIIDKLHKNELYNEYSYKIRTGMNDEDFIELSSHYVIADGGYLAWKSIIAGYSPSSDPVKYKFTDWIASVRKEVECFFGIFKGRFRWFKCPIRLHKKVDIDNAFVFACMINNMILHHDGLDVRWEAGVNWKTLNPDGHDEEDSEEDLPSFYPIGHAEEEEFLPTFVETLAPNADDDSVYKHFQSLLANHLHYTYRRGELCWPKPRKDIHLDHNVLPRLHFQQAAEL
jgi:hypothetical protein